MLLAVHSTLIISFSHLHLLIYILISNFAIVKIVFIVADSMTFSYLTFGVVTNNLNYFWTAMQLVENNTIYSKE